MNRLPRLLVDTGDDGRFRSGLAVVLGATLVLLPVTFGLIDGGTFLVASLAGVIAILPLWRLVEGPSDRPGLTLAIVVMGLVAIVIVRELSGIAGWTYLGAWSSTLGLIRFVSGWRHPVDLASGPEVHPEGGNHLVIWVAVGVPLLAIVGLVVWMIATGGALR